LEKNRELMKEEKDKDESAQWQQVSFILTIEKLTMIFHNLNN